MFRLEVLPLDLPIVLYLYYAKHQAKGPTLLNVTPPLFVIVNALGPESVAKLEDFIVLNNIRVVLVGSNTDLGGVKLAVYSAEDTILKLLMLPVNHALPD